MDALRGPGRLAGGLASQARRAIVEQASRSAAWQPGHAGPGLHSSCQMLGLAGHGGGQTCVWREICARHGMGGRGLLCGEGLLGRPARAWQIGEQAAQQA